MGRFVVIVLDGFGIGEMPDAKEVRPQDVGSNTCRHIFEEVPDLKLPTLEKLGLANITGTPLGTLKESPDAVYGKAMLMHTGADTFFGHQEIMGTKPVPPFGEPFKNKIDEIEKILTDNGYTVRRHTEQGNSFLIVNEVLTIADNVEADPGQAYNVTSALDLIPFDEVLTIGKLARSVSKVPRVITFGGRGIDLEDILSAVVVKGDYIGIDAPGSGVYDDDYHVIHLGYGVDPEVQVPTILGKANIPVYLLGKVADIVINDHGTSISMVETPLVLEKTVELLQKHDHGFFCTNVQETDLSGHGQDSKRYAHILEQADQGIHNVIQQLSHDDILIIMADHGNDPTIGHPRHTREMVPLMVYSQRATPKNLGVRSTLSDVGATVADYFKIAPPQNGASFLKDITT